MQEKESPNHYKTLPNLSNYLITEEGRVYSLIRKRYLKPHDNGIGYKQVFLKGDDLTRRWHKLHRLIALCYVDNPDNKPEVNHKDRNKANNHYTNLEWMTHKENINHSYETGRVRISGASHWNTGKEASLETRKKQSERKKGKHHPKFRGYLIFYGKHYESAIELSKELGVTAMTIGRWIKKGKIEIRGSNAE